MKKFFFRRNVVTQPFLSNSISLTWDHHGGDKVCLHHAIEPCVLARKSRCSLLSLLHREEDSGIVSVPLNVSHALHLHPGNLLGCRTGPLRQLLPLIAGLQMRSDPGAICGLGRSRILDSLEKILEEMLAITPEQGIIFPLFQHPVADHINVASSHHSPPNKADVIHVVLGVTRCRNVVRVSLEVEERRLGAEN